MGLQNDEKNNHGIQHSVEMNGKLKSITIGGLVQTFHTC